MRSVYRGDKVRFDQAFMDGLTILNPKDATWPKYSIKDPAGVVVQTGTGTSLGSGKYRAEWVATLNAALTMDNPSQNWNIEWTLTDDTNKFYNFTENFLLLDDVKIEETSREQKFVALANTAFLAKLQLPNDPYDLSLKVLITAGETELVSFSKSELTKRGNPDSGLYSFEVPVTLGAPDCQYLFLWTVTDASTSTPRYVYQIVKTIGIKHMSLIPQVRMLIDKFQKVAGTYQAYEDSDIIEYLGQGSQLVNATFPTTFWNFSGNSPLWYGSMPYFTIMGAAWYGLTAQHLLENDLAFSFNGLTTTLDVDRAGGIESALGRMDQHIKDNLKPAKYKLYRLLNGQGNVGTRVFGRRPTLENITYKVGTMQGSSILDYFQGLGIFYP